MTSDIIIQFCDAGRSRPLLEFIRANWKQGHILGRNKELLDWQYLDAAAARYNFVIGTDPSSGEILGALGFIPASRYDHDLVGADTLWLALWKVKSPAVPMLGLRLYQHVCQNLDYRVLSCVGFNEVASQLYQSLGFTIGRLKQYYMLNTNIEDYSLVVAPRTRDAPARGEDLPDSGGSHLESVSREDYWQVCARLDHEPEDGAYPRKTPAYFHERYLSHPYYDYSIWLISNDDTPRAFMVTRTVRHDDARAMRIVDFYGPETALSGLGIALQELVRDTNAEYIDFYNYGINEHIMHSAGLTTLDEQGDIVIPNHYEPFVQSNVAIECAYKFREPNCRFIANKGDGDQDRPNVLPVA